MSHPFDRSVEMTGAGSEQDARRRFESLCLPYKADLYRFVFWLCRNRSLTEDVVQETFLRAWRSIGTLSDAAAVRSWLLTIARRELARTFERKRLETVDLDSVVNSADAGLSEADRTEVDDMRAAMMQLDETYREPLVLQVLFGYSTGQIAKQLEISLPAVLTRLHRARLFLRRKMRGGAVDESDADELS
jgi:RNA polymerase sigma-70 factor, ECF subfamily